MTVAGKPSDDRKWWYTDKTGFQFDTKPRNVAYGRDGENLGSDEKYYGAGYVELPWNNPDKCFYFDEEENKTKQYNGWLNWVHKFQPDVRFSAISDKNAHLNQFPEVSTPWKFTEYVFQGINSGYSIVEPPLYDPYTLKVINHVQNPKDFVTGTNEFRRRVGKLKSSGYRNNNIEYGYYYQCKYNKKSNIGDIKKGIQNLGPKRKQFESDNAVRAVTGDLETGLIINGITYPPWYDPEAFDGYNSSFVKTSEVCGVRIKNKYKPSNRGYKNTFIEHSYIDEFDSEKTVRSTYVYSGVRLYRKDIPARCVDIGQHGNIPIETVNMIAPKSWFDPNQSYRNVIVPVVTYEVGEAMYASIDGILHATTGNNPEISIEKVTVSGYATEKIRGFDLRKILIEGTGEKIEQAHPKLGSKFHKMTKAQLASGVNNNDFVHRGCANFVGNTTTGCYCKVKQSLMSDPEYSIIQDSDPYPFDGEMETRDGLLGMIIEDFGKCTSHSEDENSTPAGKACKFYTENGPKEVAIFDAEQMTQDQYNKAMGYDKQSFVNLDPMSALGNKFSYASALLPKNLMPTGTLNTGLTGMTARRKVTYEFKKILADGRKIASLRGNQASMASDYEYVVPGTGTFAFDKKETGYGGVDTNIFSGTNLMSRHRFNFNILGCYEPSKCSSACGRVNSSSGSVDGVFAGVGEDENYCRYYNSGCPSIGINQRALEYDREYMNLVNNIVPTFRNSGIDGFQGLRQVVVNEEQGVYAACGISDTLSSIFSIDCKSNLSVDNGDGTTDTVSGYKCYFFYNKSKTDSEHNKARIFGFIKQYGKGNLDGKMDASSYLKMDCDAPETLFNVDLSKNLPWLVEIFDDYVSPTTYESYTTNLMPFIGGRMPEYKDYSAMGSEVLVPMTTTELGYDGLLSGGKGGDDEFKDSQESKSYMGYRIDKTGEYVIEDYSSVTDGKTIGEECGVEDRDIRSKLPPSTHNGATPILGTFSNTSMNADRSTRAIMRSAWVYSSDTRELINEINEAGIFVSDNESGKSSKINIANFAANCLPREREFYYCPRCCPKPYSYMEYDDSYGDEQEMYLDEESYLLRQSDEENQQEEYEVDENYNIYGEPLFYQVFTDWEAQHYQNKCPRCASIGITTELVNGGEWKFFPKCRAQGIVNYFGLPGEIIDNNGFFWKNHTEISRSFISEINGKLGSLNKNGGGYSLEKGYSADGDLESNVIKPKQKGTNIVLGHLSEDDFNTNMFIGGDEAAYTATDTRIKSGTGDEYRHLSNKSQLALGYGAKYARTQQYDDRYLDPYRMTGSGLDFISAPVFYSLRNLIEPISGYPCYNVATYDEFITVKQKGNKQRFTEVNKDIDGYFGVESLALADNDGHSENNYVQYYDEDAGKALRAYYPTSPIWWYRHDCCGIIWRTGGHDSLHFNESSSNSGGGEWAYVGNVRAGCYLFLHGWVPLDKEVVGATISFSVSGYPEEPPLGRTRQGGKIFTRHWHPYIPEHKPMANVTGDGARAASHAAEDKSMLDAIMYGDDDVYADENTDNISFDPNDYTPMLYDRKFFSKEDDNNIKTCLSGDFGLSVTQNFLSWGGFGEDIVQRVTEDSIWKELTFEEYKSEMSKFIMNLEFQVGGYEDKHKIVDTISICPPEIAAGFSQNYGQAITGLLNYTDMNTSYSINKYGMEFADKISDTSWASGGQVIEQSYDDFNSNASGSGSTGGYSNREKPKGVNVTNSAQTTLGSNITRDITKLVKEYYDDRVLRGFKATGGLKYTEIWDYVNENKVKLNSKMTENKPNQVINARYKMSNVDGYLLTASCRYPELTEEGNFPAIESGGEYAVSRKDIVNLDECGSYYIRMDYSDSDVEYNENSPEYYNNSPYVLFNCEESDENTIGAPVNGYYKDNSDSNVNGIVFVKDPENAKKCVLWSPYENEMYFTVNISGFPTETERRPYRYTKGNWNTANAICPNPNCFVHKDGKTVSEASVLSAAFVNQYKLHSFMSTSTKCGACRTDLTTGNTGAIYSGGDGIKTFGYAHIPEKDSIINGFYIEIDQNSMANENCSFSVLSIASDEAFWTVLFSVDWLPYSKLWKIGTYNDKGELVYTTSQTLPVFKGNWCDGYVFNNSKMNGYHFMARRANKIKFKARPNTKDERGEYLGNDGMSSRIFGPYVIDKSNLTNNTAIIRKFNISDVEKNCKIEISKTINFENTNDVIFSSPISVYNKQEKKVTFLNNLDLSLIESSSCYYRIVTNRYSCSVKKFQVYGFEVCSDYLKITANSGGSVIPLNNNAVSVKYLDNISKFLRVDAIYGDTVLYELKEVDSKDSLQYTTKYNSNTGLYEIVGGNFFYDSFTKNIFLPYKHDNPSYDISIFDGGFIDQTTLPKAINLYVIHGAGESVDLPITSIGGGPSYTIERDCVTELYGQDRTNPDDSEFSNIYGKDIEQYAVLPKIGKSILFANKGERYDMNWQVSNKKRLVYKHTGGWDGLRGTELCDAYRSGGCSTDKDAYEKFLGGSGDETKNGLSTDIETLIDVGGIKVEHRISRTLGEKVSGEITLTGLPNSIIGGVLYVYAPKIKTRTVTQGGNTITTYERTGGMRRTGFPFVPTKAELDDINIEKYINCVSLTKPKMVVYLRERFPNEPIE